MKNLDNGRVEYKTVDGKRKIGYAAGTPEWNKIVNGIAMSYAPNIIPCKKCDQPVVEGYCCQFCGTSEPR